MLTLKKKHKHFGGFTEVFEHLSKTCQAKMNFSIFLPPKAKKTACPVLYWLSGLTCTEETFMMKAGAQRVASELGIILVAPDTSPRNCHIEGETIKWDFGAGASFYVNATEPKWKAHYQMYDYVTKELFEIINTNFPSDIKRQGIFGHSMGGHGAMVMGLREPQYRTVSAFAPIGAPSHCPWGEKAFTGYLGSNKKDWVPYDSVQLILTKEFNKRILIDQGTGDEFLKTQLNTKLLEEAIEKTKIPITLRYQVGYDHGYYFISTFIEDHLRYHVG